ncbi:MAG: hypothetical protein QM302_09835, partial [Acidobacteriota bacterium]|nr:hypothetical protein [Acidobacteriota bacterium]
GTVQSQARMLLVHSEEPQLTLEVAHQFLEINRQMLSMADGKYKDQRFPRTILMDALLGTHALDEAMAGPIDASVTAYHITNYGTSPDVDVLQLPMQSLAFVRAAKQDAAWSFLRNRGWYMGLPRAARDKGEIPDEYRPGQHRNAFYEDLFRLEQLTVTPTEFIRRHLDWRLDAHRWRQTPQSELPNAWPLTELFLRMVLFMEKQRVDTIRTVGERLARYVMDNDEARFFRRLMLASRYIGFRTHLVNASAREAKRGNPPLISFEEFVTVFEDGDETARLDWTLARDLVLMKMMDDLHALDFDFGQSLENEAEGEGEAEQEARDDSQ